MTIDGFYVGYMTAAGGNGMAIFVFKEGVLVGSDMGGVLFDGAYAQTTSGEYQGTVSVQVPGGVTVIQGVTAPPAGLRYDVPLSMPADFLNQPFIGITTPLGKVNVKLQKLRDLP